MSYGTAPDESLKELMTFVERLSNVCTKIKTIEPLRNIRIKIYNTKILKYELKYSSRQTELDSSVCCWGKTIQKKNIFSWLLLNCTESEINAQLSRFLYFELLPLCLSFVYTEQRSD